MSGHGGARGGPRGGSRGGPRGGPRGGRAPSTPWTRLKPVEMDYLESIGLPSKGDDRLLQHKTQERYYTKIVERYMTFCSDAGERDELLRRFASLQLQSEKENQPTGYSANKDSKGTEKDIPATARPSLAPATIPTNTKGLSDVLAALRKLREGIVASKRIDDFAIQAYLFCIRLTVLVKHPESYHPAMLHLLRRIHPVQNLTRVELNEVVAYLILDTACRRNNLAEAYALRLEYGLHDVKVDGVLDAIAHDNYIKFKRILKGADGHRAKVMEYAEETMRKHTLKCFGRTYLSVELDYLEKCADAKWTTLLSNDGVGWELEGDKVIIRKVKAR